MILFITGIIISECFEFFAYIYVGLVHNVNPKMSTVRMSILKVYNFKMSDDNNINNNYNS